VKHVALLALLATTVACAPGPAANAPGDVAAVNALRDKVAQAFNAGDATAVGNLYTTDAVFAQNHQPTVTGREAIVKSNTGFFSMYSVKMTLSADETKTMGDFGFDRGRFTFALTPKAEGTPAVPMDEGRYLVLLHKDSDGQWRISHDLGNSSLPMPQIACMFFRRGADGGPIERLVDALRSHATAFGLEPVYHLKGDFGVITEFCRPALAATGELAVSVGPPLFLVSNSGPLVKDLLRGARGGGGFPAGADPASQRDPEPGRGQLSFAPARLGELLAPWKPLARGHAEPDPAWMRAQRAFVEPEVLRSGFAGVSKVEDLDAAAHAEFEKQVDAVLRQQWRDAVPIAARVDRAVLHPMQALLEKEAAGAGRLEFTAADTRTLLERLLGP